jgi:hypothetical protein
MRNGAATAADQRFLYATLTGSSTYDPDGSGCAPHESVAPLASRPAITAADLFFIG